MSDDIGSTLEGVTLSQKAIGNARDCCIRLVQQHGADALAKARNTSLRDSFAAIWFWAQAWPRVSGLTPAPDRSCTAGLHASCRPRSAG